MQKKYLALLHKIWLTHKNLFSIFSPEKNISLFENNEKNFDFKNFYENLSYEILKKYKIPENKISQILEFKKQLDEEKIFKKIDDLSVKIITFFDEDYPENLKNIFNPPFLLYVRWDISGNFFAFVGSRNITSYWKKIIEEFVPKVWKYFWIISGWALWCDFYAHKISLQNDVKTIAVFWTWIDIYYPPTNAHIFDEILEKNGALVSIFPFSEPGNPYNFPVRNEIVAGWSKWVFVVEAKQKSGSLITANLALDLGKDLFTCPWEIFKSTSAWCNELLAKNEAKLVLKAEDILEEYNIKAKNLEVKKEINFSDEMEKNIYNLLLSESLNIDKIAEKLKLDVVSVSLKISFMEIMGILKKSESWKYEIN